MANLAGALIVLALAAFVIANIVGLALSGDRRGTKWQRAVRAAATVAPERKVELVKAMGFIPTWDPHTRDCPTNFGPGNRCSCVPDATLWAAPSDVAEYMHETWEERLAAARRRKGDG